jgi:IstB-like ATP binding protein
VLNTQPTGKSSAGADRSTATEGQDAHPIAVAHRASLPHSRRLTSRAARLSPSRCRCGRQRKRVRFTTAAQLVNELVEAKNQSELNRVTNRWTRYELIVIDELGYVAMPESAVELLFQVIAGRAERAAVIITTNLPFSEWTTMFPNARLCKTMLDRLTDQAHIIETGTGSKESTVHDYFAALKITPFRAKSFIYSLRVQFPAACGVR